MRCARIIAALAGFWVVAVLSSCSHSTGPDYALQCMFDLNPVGAYEYPAGVAVPTVVPEEGGTQEGADALNACIRTRAGAAEAAPTSAEASQRSTIQTNGPVTTATYTYGTPPGGWPSEPTQAAAPSVSAEASQRSMIETDGTVTTATYTYGTPPGGWVSEPAQAAAPSTPSSVAAPRSCNLEMVGGSGYRCAP